MQKIRRTAPRYLTKSRFTLALECPTKLHYTGKPDYANQRGGNSFLLALAEGGFQVGELAKRYHPGGKEISTLDYESAEKETKLLLREQNVTLFEPAIQHHNLFIRIDVLIKKDLELELIEVKAKSFDSLEEAPFENRDGSISSGWRPYLYDVAFQTYVLQSAMPKHKVKPSFMLIDKHALCPTSGLNQKFRVVRDEHNHKGITVSSDLGPDDLTPPLVIKVPVGGLVSRILSGADADGPADFDKYVRTLANAYESDEKISSPLGPHCAKCEFVSDEDGNHGKLKSGFQECWTETLGWTEKDFKEPRVLDLWRYRRKAERISEGRMKLIDLRRSDIGIKPRKTPGLSTTERQWLQITKAKDKDQSLWIDTPGLKNEISSWHFPLHFIDFETTTMALPFHKGRRPYEGIAFQFSHHTVSRNGEVAHAGEYLNTTRGAFPNYIFVRELMRQLQQDDGTIFRYAAHENTYLCLIHYQLRTDPTPPEDRNELMTFIQSVTRSGRNNQKQWSGRRCMVDMLDLVKRFYYLPETNGSNSLKAVLPATLNASAALQTKYSQPIYGAKDGIRSLNFQDWAWVKRKSGKGKMLDPYKLLPPVFSDIQCKSEQRVSTNSELRSGGDAMIAYARTQYEEMGEKERLLIFESLKKYCELDTLAMVMLYEGWVDLTSGTVTRTGN